MADVDGRPHPTSAADVALGLGLRHNRRGYIGRCPCCGFEDRGSATPLRCHGGYAQRDLLNALGHQDQWDGRDGGHLGSAPAKAAEVDGASAKGRALALWNRATSAGFAALAVSNPAGPYLAHRDYIGSIPPALGYAPHAGTSPPAPVGRSCPSPSPASRPGTWWRPLDGISRYPPELIEAVGGCAFPPPRPTVAGERP